MELRSVKLDISILAILYVDHCKLMFETRKYKCDTSVLDLCNSSHNVLSVFYFLAYYSNEENKLRSAVSIVIQENGSLRVHCY